MLKAQDIVLLLKICSMISPQKEISDILSQNQLAMCLCMSPSEINAATKRLAQSQLLGDARHTKLAARFPRHLIMIPIRPSCEELLISGVKYFFPAQIGSYTRGIVTSYAAPIFGKKIIHGTDPVPVWPYAEGTQLGLTLKPLYPSVPKSIAQYPDPLFYDLLVLVDAIRSGRARERAMAIKLLREKLNGTK